MKTFKTEFWRYYVRGRFSKKRKNCSQNFQILRLQAVIGIFSHGPFRGLNPKYAIPYSAMITHAENSLLNDPPTRCLFSIFTVKIDSKSFLWAVRSVQEAYPQTFSYRIDNAYIRQPHADNHHRLDWVTWRYDWCVCEDHPRRVFGGLYHCAKFGWNLCSSFDNMHVFRFRGFGLKTLIHAQKNCFCGLIP